jgi:hypothetical protein
VLRSRSGMGIASLRSREIRGVRVRRPTVRTRDPLESHTNAYLTTPTKYLCIIFSHLPSLLGLNWRYQQSWPQGTFSPAFVISDAGGRRSIPPID